MTTAGHTFKKRDAVFYSTGAATIRARVETVHRDGSISVRALFYLNDHGADVPGYLGFLYRMHPADLQVGLRYAASVPA